MQHKRERDYFEWLKKAEEDELSIGAILKENGGAPSTACFLAQQMAEKCLKSLLISSAAQVGDSHTEFSLFSWLK